MSPREAKLEEALRAAIKMRRAMSDLNPVVKNLFVPREAVAAFDEVMKKLGGKKDGCE